MSARLSALRVRIGRDGCEGRAAPGPAARSRDTDGRREPIPLLCHTGCERPAVHLPAV